MLLAYGVWTLAVVLSAMAAETQQARVLTCDTRRGQTGGLPVGPMSNEVIVTVMTEVSPHGQQRRHRFEFSRPEKARFSCSDLGSVQIRISPLLPSAAYLAELATTPEDVMKGSLAVIVGALFAVGVRERYLLVSGAQ